MKFKNINRAGEIIVPSYTFRRTRMKSPTECYSIWLVDDEDYTQAGMNTLITDVPGQVAALLQQMQMNGQEVFRVYNDSGELLWHI
jgi:hypothetical protein